MRRSVCVVSFLEVPGRIVMMAGCVVCSRRVEAGCSYCIRMQVLLVKGDLGEGGDCSAEARRCNDAAECAALLVVECLSAVWSGRGVSLGGGSSRALAHRLCGRSVEGQQFLHNTAGYHSLPGEPANNLHEDAVGIVNSISFMDKVE